MKKKHLLGVLAVTLCLSACSSDNSDVDNFLNEFGNMDLKISKEWDGINYNIERGNYGETTQGFYYYDSENETMIYISKEIDKAIPLCTRVECPHGTEVWAQLEKTGEYLSDCDAIYKLNTAIQVYNGKLYADAECKNEEKNRAILRTELDGTDKQEVLHNLDMRLEEVDTSMGGNVGEVFMSSVDWFIYDDMVYILTEAHIMHKEEKTGKVYVDVYDLNTGERVKELFYKEYKSDDLIPSYLYVTTDAVYIGLNKYIEQGEDMLKSIIFIEINRETGASKEVTLEQDRNYIGYNYFDDKLIFGKQGGDVYLLDVDGNEELCIELDEREKEVGMFFSKRGDYIILNPREAVKLEDGSMGYYSKIYDSEYNYLDTIYFTENFRTKAGEGDKILYQGDDDEKYYYIDTKQIGTGNIELKEIEMPKLKKKAENETDTEE